MASALAAALLLKRLKVLTEKAQGLAGLAGGQGASVSVQLISPVSSPGVWANKHGSQRPQIPFSSAHQPACSRIDYYLTLLCLQVCDITAFACLHLRLCVLCVHICICVFANVLLYALCLGLGIEPQYFYQLSCVCSTKF